MAGKRDSDPSQPAGAGKSGRQGGEAARDERQGAQAQGRRKPQTTEGSEPREGERLEKHSSQGLAGAQGSGGGAERGVNEPPGPARPVANRGVAPSASPDPDVPGGSPVGGAGR